MTLEFAFVLIGAGTVSAAVLRLVDVIEAPAKRK